MVAKRSSRAVSRTVALLLGLPSAAFALGLGDIRLLSPLNSPLDAEIEVVDATSEELSSLQAQIASRDTFARYGLDWPMFLSSVQVKAQRGADGRQVIKLRSAESVTEPFVTLLLEVNWSRGRLVREYTMLLDPPVYTPAQSAANTPIAAPAAASSAKGGEIARAPAPAAVPAPAAEATASAPASSPPAPRQSAPGPAAAPPAAQGGTHAVRRGDTLSAIAAGVAGQGAGTQRVRAWMLAIYQANPAAFDRNMNVLRSGAVLRIPDSSTAAAISGAEASAEIRRQYAAWRGGAAPAARPAAERAGELRLVTPSEPGGSSAGTAARGEVRGLQDRVHELEGQLAESKRLLELKSGELARLQSQIAHKGGAAPSPAAAAPAAKPAAQAAPPAPAPAAAPSAPEPAAAPVAQTAPAAAAPETARPATAAKTPTPHKPAAQPVPQPSLLDSLLGYWWAGALLIAAIAAALGFKAWRSRRESAFDDSLGRLAVAGASALDRSNDTAPIRPVSAAQPEASFLVEESGSHERPRIPGAGAPAKTVTADDTISSETAINLDQGDPLAEADFHMAYGLYDQAADLIRIAIEREPARRDLRLKLLEVFFVWGNKEQFLHAAHELAESRDQAAPGEWEKIVIMGKQLAPEEPLFAGGSGGSGAAAGGVDLDLEGGQGSVDFDLLGEPVPTEAGPEGVDLDIGSALETTAESPVHATDRNLALDQALEHTIASTGTTREMTATLPGGEDQATLQMARGNGAAALHADADPEFVLEPEAPTVEQPTLALGQGPALRQKVESALKQTNVEQTAELALDDLGLDLTSLETVNGPGLEAAANSPTLVAGLDERSRKVIEEAAQRGGGEPSATGSWHIDEHELEAAFREGPAAGEDPSATSRLTTVDAENVDFDLSGAETPEVGHANGAALDLDVGTATVPDAAFTSTQKLASDDLALPDLEPVTMSEVGTKLDLARAYMDMGDPDGARNILEEVLHEGSVAQKQEAQRLMESLPG